VNDALLSLIEAEQRKADRRRAAIEATKLEIELIGDSVKLRGKLQRQEAALQQSLDNLEKLNRAGKKK